MWAAQTTLRIGEWYLGVRSSSVELDEWLRVALAAHVVAADVDANYSVIAPTRGSSPDAASNVGLLYRAHRLRVRTRSTVRLGHALVRALGAHLPAPDAWDLVAVDGWAVVHGERAVIVVGGDEVVAPEVLDRALHQYGALLADEPYLVVDPATRELVVSPSPLVEDAAFAALAALASSRDTTAGTEPPPVGTGRYPIVGWVTFAGAGGDSGADRLVSAIGAAFAPTDGDTGAVLVALRDLLEVVPSHVVRPARPRDLAARIAGMLGGATAPRR